VSVAVRPATGGDVAVIDALLHATFPSAAEARLVRDLCIDGDMVLTLVADDEATGGLVGVIAFSRMEVLVNDREVPAVALGPLAVAADHRGEGIAAALIRTGLRDVAAAGALLCFVLGDARRYAPHGFAADLASGFASPNAGEHLLAVALQDGAIPCGVRGRADYAPAFARLDRAA
jgi:putative acetyltransferase